MSATRKTEVRELEIPEVFADLYEPHRYKVYWGGRGAAKSWAFADALLLQGGQKRLRILCAREIQKSIKESVYSLLAERIATHRMDHYKVLSTEIRCTNGTEFIFEGLLRNVNSIKSIEGIDRCWIEEANTVSEDSLGKLIPSIRKAGSELWFSFNPELRSDPAYKRFVLNQPPNAVVRRVSWRDNPWLTPELEQERDYLKATNYEEYLHVWEGELRSFAVGAYYQKQLAAAREDGRITRVPYDPVLQVYTVWDLGIGDSTAIWFAQLVHNEIRLIDYYEQSGEGLPHYAKILQEKPYIYADHIAPHDIAVRELGSGKSRIEIAESLGIRFSVCPNIPVDDGIEAVRATIPRCYFDEKKCERGLEALSAYRKEYDDLREDFKPRPVHDWASHGADAFRYLAVGLKEKHELRDVPQEQYREHGWMR